MNDSRSARSLRDATPAVLAIASGVGDPIARQLCKDKGIPARSNRLRPEDLGALHGWRLQRADLQRPTAAHLEALRGSSIHELRLRDAPLPHWPVLDAVAALDPHTLHIDGFDPDDDPRPPAGPSLRRVTLTNQGGPSFGDPFVSSLVGTPLEHLSLDHAEALTDEGIRALDAMPLERLGLGRTSLTPHGIAHLARHPLHTLRLGWNGNIVDDPSCLSDFVALRALALDRCYADDTIVAALRAPHLCSLHLEASYVTSQGLARLAELPLRDLGLAEARFDLASGLDALRPLPLRRLDISNLRHFSNDALQALQAWPLEHLSLSLTPALDRTGLAHLARCSVTSLTLAASGSERGPLPIEAVRDLPLRRLDLAMTTLTEDSLRWLSNMPLEHLSLQGVKGLSVRSLEALGSLPLRTLDLGQFDTNWITVEALPILEALPLEELTLFNCAALGNEAWDRLAALPARVWGPGI